MAKGQSKSKPLFGAKTDYKWRSCKSSDWFAENRYQNTCVLVRHFSEAKIAVTHCSSYKLFLFRKLSSERAIIHQWSTNESLFLWVGLITRQAIHSVWKIYNYYSPISPIKGVLFIYGMRLRCLAFSNKKIVFFICAQEKTVCPNNCPPLKRNELSWSYIFFFLSLLSVSFFFFFFFHRNTDCWLVRLTVN